MKDKAYLTEFVKNIFDDSFSDASANLTNCVNEKVKAKMKTYMVEKKYVQKEGDEDSGKGGFVPFKKGHNKKGDKGEKKKEKSHKPKRGGKRD